MTCPTGYTDQADTDYNSNDIGSCGAYSTVAAAGAACTSNPACKGFSLIDQYANYAKHGPWCLKSDVTTPYRATNHHFCIKNSALPPGWKPPKRCEPSKGDYGCCTQNQQCGMGEGDCDFDSDCISGMECVDDIGADFGGSALFDICVPIGTYTMPPTAPPTKPDCRPSLNDYNCCGGYNGYLCQDGEGDCDYDSDCAAGLFCTDDIGAKYGGNALLDVCTSLTRPPTPMPTDKDCDPAKEDWSCCSGWDTCKRGDGDCDGDSDCNDGLWCAEDYGGDWGSKDKTFDVCLGFGDICPPSKNDLNCCGGDPNTMGRRRLSHGGGYGGGGYYYGGGGGGWGCGYGSGYTKAGYLCGVGEGGCTKDDDCALGLQCKSNMGKQYGSMYVSMGICMVPPGQASRCDPKIAEWDCCDTEYPCDIEEGDCDYDSHCKGDLYCEDNVGAEYGVSSSFDVCRSPQTESPTMSPTRTPTMAPTPSPTVDCTIYKKKDCKKNPMAKANCKVVKGGACMPKNIPNCAAYNILGKKAKKPCSKDKTLKCFFDTSTGLCGPFSCANYSGRKSKDCDKQKSQCEYDNATKTCNPRTTCTGLGKKDCAAMVTSGRNANCVFSGGQCTGASPTNKPTAAPLCSSYTDKKACGKAKCKWDRKSAACM